MEATASITNGGRPAPAMAPRSCASVSTAKSTGAPVNAASIAARSAPVTRSGPDRL